MKNIILLLMLTMYINTLLAQHSLSGYVLDKETNSALPGASIYIPDLKTGTATDLKGFFIIRNLPSTKLIIQVKYLGYATSTQTVNIVDSVTIDFLLEPASIEGKQVVITGTAITSESERNSVAVKTVDRNEIVSVASTNLIDALAHTPGVSQITTGNAISKPVIRGLSYNRIITLNDGTRQEGQQWGDEHGIEIDKYSADRIEVMRGPASLMYGSDALGGVINILDPVVPQPGTLRGDFTTQFFTNEKLTGNSLMLEGNTKGLFSRVRGSFTDAGAYHTPDGEVENSGFREINFGGGIGLNKKWGYTHLDFSQYNATIGLLEGVHAHFDEEETEEGDDEHEHAHVDGRDIELPYQNVVHNKITLNNRFYTGRSQLTIKTGWQQNIRKEFEHAIDEADLSLDLQSYTADIKYFFPEKNNWQSVMGVSGMQQQNTNKGEEFLIPDYNLKEAGIFLYLKKNYERLSWNAGVRFDVRQLISDPLISEDTAADFVFYSFKRNFSATTGAVGLTYKLNEIFHIKSNVGSGFRAPNISELASNGIHSGTFRYEIGNSSLKPEQSLQFDFSLVARSKKVDGELSVFTNYITNYIYPANFTGETIIAGETVYPVYRFTQGNALLSGFEFSLDAHLLHNLHFENAISFVHGSNMKTEQPLALIPPMAIHNELRYDFHFLETKVVKEPFIKFSVDNHLPQKRVEVFETPTKGYSLINTGAGANFSFSKVEFLFSIDVHNLTDRKYVDHLNRLKEFGILNKGRNITFSLQVPFSVLSGS